MASIRVAQSLSVNLASATWASTFVSRLKKAQSSGGSGGALGPPPVAVFYDEEGEIATFIEALRDAVGEGGIWEVEVESGTHHWATMRASEELSKQVLAGKHANQIVHEPIQLHRASGELAYAVDLLGMMQMGLRTRAVRRIRFYPRSGEPIYPIESLGASGSGWQARLEVACSPYEAAADGTGRVKVDWEQVRRSRGAVWIDGAVNWAVPSRRWWRRSSPA